MLRYKYKDKNHSLELAFTPYLSLKRDTCYYLKLITSKANYMKSNNKLNDTNIV
jgi:hypothetical protein